MAAGALLVLLVGALAAMAVSAPSSSGSTETRYVGQLRAAAAQAEASRSEIKRLDKNDTEGLKAAGERLAASTAAAKQALRTYQGATTRFGSPEEHRLVTRMLQSLRRAGADFGKLTGSPIKTTPRRRTLAEKFVRQVRREAVAAAVEKWPGIEKVAALFENPRQARRLVARELRKKLARELERKRAQIATRAISRSSIPIQLGVPLRQQVRAEAERWAARRLARVLLKVDASGLVLQLFGDKIVKAVVADIVRTLRPSKKVVPRTAKTLRGFAGHQEALRELLTRPNADLDEVEAAVGRAEAALLATRDLHGDLRRLVRRRCKGNPTSKECRGAQKTLAKLLSGRTQLTALVKATRRMFLLNSQFEPGRLRGWIAGLSEMERDVARINRKLASSPGPAPSRATWTGTWTRREHAGTYQLTQSGTSVSGTFDHHGGGPISGTLSEGGSRWRGTVGGGPASCLNATFDLTLNGKAFVGTYTCPNGSSGDFSADCTGGACLRNSGATTTAHRSGG